MTAALGAHHGGAASGGRGAHAVHAMRVLIVDDHVDTADALQILLEHAGYEVRAACSAAAAIAIAREFAPELVVVDIRLPDMTGYDLAPLLRAAGGGEGPRVIALSSVMAPDYRLAGRFDEVVRKPVSGAELRRLLRRHEPR